MGDRSGSVRTTLWVEATSAPTVEVPEAMVVVALVVASTSSSKPAISRVVTLKPRVSFRHKPLLSLSPGFMKDKFFAVHSFFGGHVNVDSYVY